MKIMAVVGGVLALAWAAMFAATGVIAFAWVSGGFLFCGFFAIGWVTARGDR